MARSAVRHFDSRLRLIMLGLTLSGFKHLKGERISRCKVKGVKPPTKSDWEILILRCVSSRVLTARLYVFFFSPSTEYAANRYIKELHVYCRDFRRSMARSHRGHLSSCVFLPSVKYIHYRIATIIINSDEVD